MYEKDGWSGDFKEKGLLNGRAAYTNTVWRRPCIPRLSNGAQLSSALLTCLMLDCTRR